MPENNSFDWLVYESLFNKDKFKKPKCKFKLSLYLIPLNELAVWLRDDISDSDAQAFCDAFFPDLSFEDLKGLANGFWPWKAKDSDLVGSMSGNKFCCTPRQSSGGTRGVLIIYAQPYAVLPYNRFDNTANSSAIGTKNHGALLRVKDEDPYRWDAWKTASRSCVVKLPDAPVKPKNKTWLPINQQSIAQLWTDWHFSAEHRAVGCENLAGEHYDLTRRGARDYSLKTGVEYVGRNHQGGFNHKDVIGDWLIGCLRSDYIKMVDQRLRPPGDGLIVLTELITVTEKLTRTHSGNSTVRYKEGIQVRDLSVLDKSKIYLAPLNIPFMGPDENNDFKTLKEEFHYLKETATETQRQKWCDFWKYAYAASLGRTKALFLLRYGLQIMNPNVQNFLIEFKKDNNGLKPTNNMVIRDLNDASVVREVVWALFDGAGLPPEGRENWKRLAELAVPTFKFEFEEGRMAREDFDYQDCQETGSTPLAFGPSGIQFLWQRFSAFTNGTKGEKIQEEEALRSVWQKLLWAMADWGIAHNKAYINCIEKHLGKNFREIDWGKLPDPSRYRTLNNDDLEKAELYTLKSGLKPEFTDSSLKVTGQNNFNFPANQLEWAKKFPATTPFESTLLGWPCLILYGEGFDQTTRVSLGSTQVKKEDIFIGNGGKQLYIRKTDPLNEIFLAVSGRKMEITVTNPGPPEKKSSLRLVPDINEPGEMGWEEISAKVIHDYLKSAAGQTALKNCRDSGWTLVKPAVTIRLTGTDGKPFAWKRVFFKIKNEDRGWTDLTNSRGEIYVYKETSNEQIEICPQKDPAVKNAPTYLECRSTHWEGITIKVA